MAKGNENLPSGDIHHVPFIAFNIVIFSIPTEPNSIKVGWDSILELDLDNSIFIKMAKQNKFFFLLIELKFICCYMIIICLLFLLLMILQLRPILNILKIISSEITG
jgi:hypothetical protein